MTATTRTPHGDKLAPHPSGAAPAGAASDAPEHRRSGRWIDHWDPTSYAAMARHVDAYEDEWKAVLEDPDKLRRFGSFVNAPSEPDPDLAYVVERGQIRPATVTERAVAREDDAPPTLIAGSTLEVRR